MDMVTLPDGSRTSRIGLGCGRLVGGVGSHASARLIEAARLSGITHFDVAPSYGLGLAEDVLGQVIGDDTGVTIVTKVGIARPTGGHRKALLRQILRPMLAFAPNLKAQLVQRTVTSEGVARGRFAPAEIEASLNESLYRLCRTRVTGLLLHEPGAEIAFETAALLEAVRIAGLAGAIGVGTVGAPITVPPFGTIRQHLWTIDPSIPEDGAVHIVHGVLRGRIGVVDCDGKAALLRETGRDPADVHAWPGLLLSVALATTPSGIVLISSNDRARIRGAVAAIEWAIARGEQPDTVRIVLRKLQPALC